MAYGSRKGGPADAGNSKANEVEVKMSFNKPGALLLIGLITVLASAPARAEDGPMSMDAGKNAAQLFASDCAICHKSAQGLAKAGGMFGLQGFLREHYTASRESAAVLAKYLEAVGDPRAPARPSVKRPPKGDERAKIGDGKTGDGKANIKPDGKKPEEAKPADSKPADAKASESKPLDNNSSDSKPAVSRPAESKPEKSE
jgi:mono/diheme cytochrome c family protein